MAASTIVPLTYLSVVAANHSLYWYNFIDTFEKSSANNLMPDIIPSLGSVIEGMCLVLLHP